MCGRSSAILSRGMRCEIMALVTIRYGRTAVPSVGALQAVPLEAAPRAPPTDSVDADYECRLCQIAS